MTVRRADDGTIHLEGICPVEDAEPLLQLLLAGPKPSVDWSKSQKPHTAVVQVLLAAGAVPAQPCGDGWIAKWL
jgi:hypothetical protein